MFRVGQAGCMPDQESTMSPSASDEPLFAAIEDAPEDLARRSVYADWLEERGDARAAYVRLGREVLDPRTPDARRREARKAAKRSRPGFDARWLRCLDAQDLLCQVSQRL